jgi:hypothetical protein
VLLCASFILLHQGRTSPDEKQLRELQSVGRQIRRELVAEEILQETTSKVSRAWKAFHDGGLSECVHTSIGRPGSACVVSEPRFPITLLSQVYKDRCGRYYKPPGM